MKKSAEGFCQDQHDCKDDSRTSKKRSAAASLKLGAARGTNSEKQVGLGEQSDKSHQSNPTQVSKLQPVPVMKRKIQKTAGAAPKVASAYNLRSRDQKSEGAKDPPAYNLRSKVRKTEGENASTIQKRKTPKRDSSKDSSVALQKKGILKTELQKTSSPKSSAPPIKKIGTTKPLTTSLAGHDKNQPSSSQYEPYFREPIFHIRWEGDMENGPFGQNCILCNKDLSGATEDDDSELNDDFEYEDDDDDGEYEYYDDLTPPLLPAVDILPCGHAYHTECLQHGTHEKQSSDPQCILCSRMA
ncbi:uncharacterized protein LOC112505707 [Cynara cardunculus var. scolymus]